MSVRRGTTNRMTLYRECGICGRSIVTTADTPWVRQMPRDGKKQATVYFCSEKCFAASYKHIGWYDGKTEQRRAEREANRDTKEKNRRYYATHREEEKARQKARYYGNLEASRLTVQFNHQKRRARGLE